MQNKIIKTSKRGLTFSFDATESFKPGSRYSYFVSDNQVIIKASEDGRMKVSQKKTGHKIKSLFDLRSKAVVEKLQKADFVEIQINGEQIVVSLRKKAQARICEKSVHSVESILRSKVVGVYEFSAGLLDTAVGCEGYQLTLQDCFSSCFNKIGDEKTVRKELQDVFKVVSLFSGSGMFDYPFAKDKNFDIIFACDKNASAVESHKHNIGSHVVCGDIRDIRNVGKADVVIGGPSCRSFSNANRSQTRLLSHPDYRLVDEYVRLVKESTPDVFVIENVPEFVSANEGELLQAVVEELSEYQTTVNLVTDADVGGFTNRKRAFIIGSKIGEIRLPALKVLPRKTVKEALSKVDATWFNFNDISKSKPATIEKMQYVPNGGNWEDIPVSLRDKGTHSNHYRRLHPDGISPAMVNIRKVCMMPPTDSPNPNRILSVAEALALSGFNKSFAVFGKLADRQQQVGDGVPFYMGSLVKDTIKKALLKAKSRYA